MHQQTLYTPGIRVDTNKARNCCWLMYLSAFEWKDILFAVVGAHENRTDRCFNGGFIHYLKTFGKLYVTWSQLKTANIPRVSFLVQCYFGLGLFSDTVCC